MSDKKENSEKIMEKAEFYKQLIDYANTLNINISREKADLLYKYMELLLEWNEKINLTAITNQHEIILKHFIDSLSINKYVKDKEYVMDVGTGAGFPGIPLKIINDEINFTLVDSLNKRINFLEDVKEKLGIKKLELIHSRVEDLAKNKAYREKADIVVSRAVASLRVLVEYMIPFVKVNGYCICMKGSNINDEINDSKKAIDILGGKLEKVDNLILPENLERNILVIKKIKETPLKYPRKAGIPSKQPL